MKCERCGSGTSGYSLFDYCAACGKNLCESCMGGGCCGVVPAASGMEQDEAEEERRERNAAERSVDRGEWMDDDGGIR